MHDVKSPSRQSTGDECTRDFGNFQEFSQTLARAVRGCMGIVREKSLWLDFATAGASHFNLAELVIKFHATYRTIDSTMASESNKIVEDQNFMNQDDTIYVQTFCIPSFEPLTLANGI